MRRLIVIVSALAMLTAVNLSIHSREHLIESGRIVLLELAPVDPRSLMQGDYMALRFKAGTEAFGTRPYALSRDGHIVLAVDANGVGAFRRIDEGLPLTEDEARLRFRIRSGVPNFATNAFFFEEGHAQEFATARYGEFRVAPNGDSVLTGLRDGKLAPLGRRSPG